MYDSIAVYFFGDLVEYMNTIYKNVEIHLTVDTSASLANEIQSGSIDLAIGVNLEKKIDKTSEYFLLFEDKYSFYASPKIKKIDNKLPLIVHPRAEDDNSGTIEEYLGEIILQHGTHRAFNFETLKILTVQGLGIGVLPTQVAKPLVKERQLQPIQITRVKTMFGRHNIGFLASKKFLHGHGNFVKDLYRIGERWSKF